MEKYCKLVMVTEDNNNKYYEMVYNGGGEFIVTYGRVEQSSTVISKPIREWDKVRNAKLRKGYKSISDATVKIEKTKERDIENLMVRNFISKMRHYTTSLVSETYSVKAKDVSQYQILEAQKLLNEISSVLNDKAQKLLNEISSVPNDKAQKLLNEISSVPNDKAQKLSVPNDKAQKLLNEISSVPNDNERINRLLLSLYSCIPRRIKNVKNSILPYIDLETTMLQEQDNLDALSSQINRKNELNEKLSTVMDPHIDKYLISLSTSYNINLSILKSLFNDEKTFLEIINIKMDHYKGNDKELLYLIDQLKTGTFEIFEVQRPQENGLFTEYLSNSVNKKTRLLVHGTRCSSVIPILQTGLKIRPSTSVHFSGKVYGEGNYFSEHVQKSINYTGRDKDKVLLVYEVHTGNEYIYEGWYDGDRGVPLSYEGLQKKGYDSTYVRAGNGLQNSEIISYHKHQSQIKYIIHMS
jgi:hypothetical protein